MARNLISQRKRGADVLLNPLPSARGSRSARQSLERSLLRSCFDMVVVARQNFDLLPSVADGANTFITAIAHAHEIDYEPGKYVRAELFSWYFDVRNAVERRDHACLVRMAERLSAILALPAAKAVKRLEIEEPLSVLMAPGPIVLGDLDCPVGDWPVAGPGARLIVEPHCITVRDDAGLNTAFSVGEIEQWGTYPLASLPIKIRQSGAARRRAAEKYTADLLAGWWSSDDIYIVDPKEAATSVAMASYVQKYADGIFEIQHVWPEAFDELLELCDTITMVKGLPFIGGSAISTFGTAYFNLLPEWSSMTFADHIIHEAAHQRLHVQFELQPALYNPTERRGVSPIRQDQRAVEGIFHATFVFLRLSQYFLKRRELIEENAEARSRLHRHALGLQVGLKSLSSVADFTPEGHQFFVALREQAAEVALAVGEPLARYYRDIPVDYVTPETLAEALQE